MSRTIVKTASTKYQPIRASEFKVTDKNISSSVLSADSISFVNIDDSGNICIKANKITIE